MVMKKKKKELDKKLTHFPKMILTNPSQRAFLIGFKLGFCRRNRLLMLMHVEKLKGDTVTGNYML